MFSIKFSNCGLVWRRKWQSTSVLLPGKSHGQRSLVGYSYGVAKSQTRLRDFTFTFHFHFKEIWASLIAQLVKNLPAMQETLVRFLGREDALAKG